MEYILQFLKWLAGNKELFYYAVGLYMILAVATTDARGFFMIIVHKIIPSIMIILIFAIPFIPKLLA